MTSEEERRRIVKEAIQEWLDSKWAAFGKWSAAGVSAAIIAAALYIIIFASGIRAP